MVVTLIILALSAVFFVSGKIRSDVVALCALVLLLLFHILTPDEALSGFWQERARQDFLFWSCWLLRLSELL